MILYAFVIIRDNLDSILTNRDISIAAFLSVRKNQSVLVLKSITFHLRSRSLVLIKRREMYDKQL